MPASIYSLGNYASVGPGVLTRRRKPSVLVVDDEDGVLYMVKDILEDDGFTVLTATDGRKGLLLAAHARPDVVVTDLMMPGISGRVLRERLQHDPRTARIPVLLMSAAYKPQPGDQFAGVIGKPFEIDELLRLVHRQMRLARVYNG